ncbi:MAG: D-amino-acid transaminase [Pseudomonadota bacterium]
MTQPRLVYVNGSYVPEHEAQISVFDRGFLFADAVYEVSTVLNGQLVDNDAHLLRLERSLRELQMASPVPMADIPAIQRHLIAENALIEGVVYLQVSRGAADRDFGFPATAQPSLVVFTQSRAVLDTPAAKTGISVISIDDIRWKRRDIKTVNLLAPVLAKQQAKDAGADDAWMVEDGFVTEGSSNNAFIITKSGALVTRQLGHEILHGITRKAVLAVAQAEGLTVEERAFTLDEAYDAAEAFVTSASTFVMPVVKIDDRIMSNSAPGPLTLKLREKYIEFAKASLS